MSNKSVNGRMLQCQVNEECSNMAFPSVKAFQSHQRTHKPPRKKGTKPAAAKPPKKKTLSEATPAKDLLHSLPSINVKVSTEPQNGNEPEPNKTEINKTPKSTKVVVSKQPPQQKRPPEESNSSISLKPKAKSRKLKPQKKDEAVVLDQTDSRLSAPRRFSVPCHCAHCLPCTELCCENPAVRSGRCCDPETLGHCLQPLQVTHQFYNLVSLCEILPPG